MTPTQEAAMRQALEALDACSWEQVYATRGALRAALAEPVQKPVAIVGTQEDTWKGYGGQWAPPGPPIKMVHMLRELPEGMLLYTAPPQRKPLTDVQRRNLVTNWFSEDWAIEQALGLLHDYDIEQAQGT